VLVPFAEALKVRVPAETKPRGRINRSGPCSPPYARRRCERNARANPSRRCSARGLAFRKNRGRVHAPYMIRTVCSPQLTSNLGASGFRVKLTNRRSPSGTGSPRAASGRCGRVRTPSACYAAALQSLVSAGARDRLARAEEPVVRRLCAGGGSHERTDVRPASVPDADVPLLSRCVGNLLVWPQAPESGA